MDPHAMDEGDDDLAPIKILIDGLQNDDAVLRLKAIQRLATIATALGPERTREELVPFLNHTAAEREDEEEVLLALAEGLGGLIDLVGGHDRAHCILLPLETLCAMEDASVRDKAVATVGAVCKVMPKSQLTEHVLPLLRRMCTGDYNTTRIAAAPIFAFVYQQLSSPAQAELRGLFSQLCRDNAPMVRKAACAGMAQLVIKMDVDLVMAELVPLFSRLAQDDQDSVRILAVENCVALGKVLTPAAVTAHVLPVVKSLVNDKSWRVRYMAADKFTELCDAVGPAVTESEMLPSLVKLLRDSEAEVRTAAAFKVAVGCERVPSSMALQQVLPSVRDLVSDASQHVRAALASSIMALAPVFGKEITIEHLLPLFLQLLKDDYHEVRLNIIAKLEHVNKVIGVHRLSQSLLPAIIDLAEDRQWRVRLAIIEHIPLLASQLGIDFFEERLGELCMSWLSDCVFSIREAATLNLKRLAEVFGSEWTQRHIVPSVLELGQHTNYLYRMTSIFAIKQLGPVVSNAVVMQMLPSLLKAASDPVPNCRFNAAKALQLFLPLVDANVAKTQVRPCLERLLNDWDPDVKHFAGLALRSQSS